MLHHLSNSDNFELNKLSISIYLCLKVYLNLFIMNFTYHIIENIDLEVLNFKDNTKDTDNDDNQLNSNCEITNQETALSPDTDEVSNENSPDPKDDTVVNYLQNEYVYSLYIKHLKKFDNIIKLVCLYLFQFHKFLIFKMKYSLFNYY